MLLLSPKAYPWEIQLNPFVRLFFPSWLAQVMGTTARVHWVSQYYTRPVSRVYWACFAAGSEEYLTSWNGRPLATNAWLSNGVPSTERPTNDGGWLAEGWSDEKNKEVAALPGGTPSTTRYRHADPVRVLVFIPHGADWSWISWEPIKLKLYGLVKSSSDQKPMITNAVAKSPSPHLHSEGKLSQRPSLALASEESLSEAEPGQHDWLFKPR